MVLHTHVLVLEMLASAGGLFREGACEGCVTATKPQEAHESGDSWRDTAHKTEHVRYIVGRDLAPCVMRDVDGVIGYAAAQEASARW